MLKLSPESVKATPQERQSLEQMKHLLELQDYQAKLVGANGQAIHIPESLYELLIHIVRVMSLGQTVLIAPQQQELTTQQAADFLNISRPYLVKLLDQKEIPSIKVGTHRRVIFEDLLIYKEKRDAKRREGIKGITQFLESEGYYNEDNSEYEETE